MAISEGKSYLASGSVNPSSFVKSATTDFYVQQCGSGDQVYGVSQAYTFDPPGVAGSGTVAASNGQTLLVYHQGDVCDVTAGSAGFTAGDLLGPDANGNAQTLTPGSGTYYGAKALRTAGAGTLGRVEVMFGKA